MTAEIEIWKNIEGYENYQISSLGRVKSFKRNKEIFLKFTKCKKGYLRVTLNNKSISKTIRIHILVAKAFLNHFTNGTLNKVIDHIDNNKENNKSDNLQIITNRENCSKDKKNKTSKYIGVSFDKSRNKWFACIRDKNKNHKLGRFNTEEEAKKAYDKKLQEILNE